MSETEIHEHLPAWAAALNGTTASIVANVIAYPLDIVKTKLQAQPKKGSKASLQSAQHYEGTLDAFVKIVREDGVGGLYTGMPGALLGVASMSYAYFYWHSLLRGAYLNANPNLAPSAATELLLGAGAGSLAQVCTIPVAVITTRQQTAPKSERKDLIGTAREIVNSEDGYSGLWRGLKAGLILSVNPAITYGAYERLRNVLFAGKKNLKAWESFLLGALSKAMATIVSQPLIVAKVGLQSTPPASRHGRPFKTFGEVLSHIVKNEGLLGVFKGLGPQLLKGLLVQGLIMSIKDRCENIFILLYTTLKQNNRIKGSAGLAHTASKRVI